MIIVRSCSRPCVPISLFIIGLQMYFLITHYWLSSHYTPNNKTTMLNKNLSLIVKKTPLATTTFYKFEGKNSSFFLLKMMTTTKEKKIEIVCNKSYLDDRRKFLDRKHRNNQPSEDLPVTWKSSFDMDSIDQSQEIDEFVVNMGDTICFKQGTTTNRDNLNARDFTKTIFETSILNASTDSAKTNNSCVCNSYYRGKQCNIPQVVWASNPPINLDKITLRKNPRRIIQAFPFNIEYEMLEARFDENGDVVDVFLILESNYTAYGANKKLYLLDKLKKNLIPKKIADKIVHIFLDYFPKGGKNNGWIAQGLLTNYLGTHGAKKLKNWKDDDLWITSDADEVPKKEVLIFLKWNDNYPLPISLFYEWSVFGFFWQPDGRNGRGFSAVADMAMYKYIYDGEVYRIRSGFNYVQKNPCNMKLITANGGILAPWTIGSNDYKAGWHCSWCTDLRRIRAKLLSAQNGDFPRWGDYPEKSNLSYIKKIVKEGMWFDDKTRMLPAINFKLPDFFKKGNNSILYRHILTNIYLNE